MPGRVRNYRWLSVAAITVLPALASGHVAPSRDDNNRYVKLTPMGDRVRVAYTVFYGDNPGRVVRRAIDTNRDGAIAADEAQAFANQVADEVGRAVEVTIDGAAQPIHWAHILPGMGSAETAAGAFSIDLVAWLCLPSLRGTHHVTLRDQFRIPKPGETEIHVEDSPGVTIDHTHVGRHQSSEHIYKFLGPGGALSDDGLDLTFTAGDRAAVMTDATCAGVTTSEEPRATPTLAAWILAAVGAGAAVLGYVALRRRRKS